MSYRYGYRPRPQYIACMASGCKANAAHEAGGNGFSCRRHLPPPPPPVKPKEAK